jgi:hypothetical protein
MSVFPDTVPPVVPSFGSMFSPPMSGPMTLPTICTRSLRSLRSPAVPTQTPSP